MTAYERRHTILQRRELCPGTVFFRISAPLVARKIEAGQFVIVRPNTGSERMPLSIAGWDREAGTLDLVIMGVGVTSLEATDKELGDAFSDVVGPLGRRSHVAREEGTSVVIGGGYGTGAVIPTARDLRALGNRVVGIVGARRADLLIMVEQLSEACDEVLLTTNDGSAGTEGFVTHALAQLIEVENVSSVLAVGPVPMMEAVTRMCEQAEVPCQVSLNAIMLDGTGMCGACRVSVGGETRFACVHGPDFDGAGVDFEELRVRQRMFAAQEEEARRCRCG